MNLPTNSQVNAGLRHAGTAAVSAATVLGVLGLLDQAQVQDVIADIHQVFNGLQDVFGGASKLVIILGPVAAGLFAKGAVMSASLKNQLKAVTSNPQVQIPDGAIKAPAAIANAVPNDKVVPIEKPQ